MRYDAAFYRREEQVAIQSARAVWPHIVELIGRQMAVCDVGCGTGGWLAAAKGHGATKVVGFDSYNGAHLLEPAEFIQCDIANGVHCSEFDLAICLEVAEHLPESSADPLVAGLCEARVVLFSAAHPGQGGVHHVTERWSSWWAEKFRKHGLHGTSDLKLRIWNDEAVADFYRENILIFARPGVLKAARLFPAVIDVVHPSRLGEWP